MKRLTNSARRSLARGPRALQETKKRAFPPGTQPRSAGRAAHSARRIAQNIKNIKKNGLQCKRAAHRAPDLVRSMSGEVSRDQAEVEKAHARPLNLNSLDHYVPRKMLTVRNRPRTKGASYLVLGRLRGRVLT